MFTRPRPATVLALTTAAAISASLAGCGDSTASASPESPSAPATHSTPTPSGSAPASHPSDATISPSSSHTTAAGAPGVPEPARHHTTKGAIAFAKHYVKKTNDTYMDPKVGVLEPLALASCKTCNNFEDSVEKMHNKNWRSDSKTEVIRSARRIRGETGVVVEVMIDTPRLHIVDANGRPHKTVSKTRNAGLVFFLAWTDQGWRVKEIKSDMSRAS